MLIQFHLAMALAALGLGTANPALAKGTFRHSVFGWSWIAAMLCVPFRRFRSSDRMML